MFKLCDKVCGIYDNQSIDDVHGRKIGLHLAVCNRNLTIMA